MGTTSSRRLAVAALLLAVAGCARYRVSTDWDPAADWSRLGTYDWRAAPAGVPRDPRVDDELLERRIRAAVDAELYAKGYRQVTDAQPDFLVAWNAVVDRRHDVQTYPGWVGGYGGWGWGPGFWGLGVGTDIRVDEYDEGTLILDVIDARSNHLLWRGSAAARIPDDRGTPEERTVRVREAVHAILERFPPPPRPRN